MSRGGTGRSRLAQAAGNGKSEQVQSNWIANCVWDKGIDAARACCPKEIKALRETAKPDECASPVVKEIRKGGKVGSDPLHALFPTPIGGKRCVVQREPDSDLRDTEQVPLLEQGGIEAFLRREVLPHAPDAWFEPSGVRIRVRDQLHMVLFYRP